MAKMLGFLIGITYSEEVILQVITLAHHATKLGPKNSD